MFNTKIEDEYCLEVKGDLACFTRPDFKVERVSYPFITPSAARGIFDAILYKPAMRWEITRIEVLNPIEYIDIRRNEVPRRASMRNDGVFIEDVRTQKTAKMLRDVRYRIWARLIYIPIDERPKTAFAVHLPEEDECEMKYHEIFQKRTACGMEFHHPYLGTRECSARWRRISDVSKEPAPIRETRDMGLTFFDWDYISNPKRARWYCPYMKNGVIIVPEGNSKDIL